MDQTTQNVPNLQRPFANVPIAAAKIAQLFEESEFSVADAQRTLEAVNEQIKQSPFSLPSRRCPRCNMPLKKASFCFCPNCGKHLV